MKNNQADNQINPLEENEQNLPADKNDQFCPLKKETVGGTGGSFGTIDFENLPEGQDRESARELRDFLHLTAAFDLEDPESMRKAAEQGNDAAMYYYGRNCIFGENKSYFEADKWFRKASESSNRLIAACARISQGLSLYFQGDDDKEKESRAILTKAVADPVFEKPLVQEHYGNCRGEGQHLLAYMLLHGQGGYTNAEEALRLARAAIVGSTQKKELQKIIDDAEDLLRRHEKSVKQAHTREVVRVRGSHAGILLLRLGEIAALIAFVPLAQQIFKLGSGSADLLAAAHYAVLAFLLLSIPWLLFYLLGRDDPSSILGWLFWGVLIGAVCTYGVFRLERWSVVRAHYQTYTVALTVLGACLIVYFLCRAVRHLAGIFTGK